VPRGNAEFLREGYEALARGDMDTFTALAREHLGPDFEFHHVWDGRVFRGVEGTMEWISDTRETWDRGNAATGPGGRAALGADRRRGGLPGSGRPRVG
jgi:hypothetical protein